MTWAILITAWLCTGLGFAGGIVVSRWMREAPDELDEDRDTLPSAPPVSTRAEVTRQ